MSRPFRAATKGGSRLRVVGIWSVLTLLCPPFCHAQSADGLAVLSPLQFGTIAVLGPGAVTVFAEGSRLAEGQTYFIGADSSQPAQVVVASRTAHMAFSLSLPDSFVLASDTGPATLMVSRLKSSRSCDHGCVGDIDGVHRSHLAVLVDSTARPLHRELPTGRDLALTPSA